VFNGAREPFLSGVQILYRCIDGNQKPHVDKFLAASDVRFTDLPVFDNFGDNYRVIVFTDDHEQAGLFPVKVASGKEIALDVLLIPKNAVYNFNRASFSGLAAIDPRVPQILSSGLDSDAAARRWTDTFEQQPAVAACLLNILAVTANTSIAGGRQLLGFLQQVVFDDRLKQDRFFCWADRTVIPQLRLPPETSAQVRFVPADSSLHPGATGSVKAKQYAEANIQITFHENDEPPTGHPDWALLELDIDYFDDPAAHFFLEVIPNGFTGSLTDPAQVLALRWMAERRAGRDFDPLYTLRLV
jgi:hypothetical protein